MRTAALRQAYRYNHQIASLWADSMNLRPRVALIQSWMEFLTVLYGMDKDLYFEAVREGDKGYSDGLNSIVRFR